ncbi:MAG: hypothetical protein JWO60_1482 [Frankiales bacterium]|nr:hypothetical protein [Frankiales bacterium]
MTDPSAPPAPEPAVPPAAPSSRARSLLRDERVVRGVLAGVLGLGLFLAVSDTADGGSDEVRSEVSSGNYAAESALQQTVVYTKGTMEATLLVHERLGEIEGLLVAALVGGVVLRAGRSRS